MFGALPRLLGHASLVCTSAHAAQRFLRLCGTPSCRLKPLRNLLSLQLHAREIRGSLPPALFRCLNRLQHLAISGAWEGLG